MSQRSKAALRELIPFFTMTPDVVYDWWMPLFAGAEWKVVSYIVRKTYGWQKMCDTIPLEQFYEGQERDGEAVDGGTGLSRRAVIDALEVLVAAGVVLKVARDDGHNRPLPSEFALNLAWDYRTKGAQLAAMREREARKKRAQEREEARQNGSAETAPPLAVAGSAETAPPGHAETAPPPRLPAVQKLHPPYTCPESSAYPKTAAANSEPALSGRKGGSTCSPPASTAPQAPAAAAALMNKEAARTGSGMTALSDTLPFPSVDLSPDQAGVFEALLGLPGMEEATALSLVTTYAGHLDRVRAWLWEATTASKRPNNPLGNPAGFVVKKLREEIPCPKVPSRPPEEGARAAPPPADPDERGARFVPNPEQTRTYLAEQRRAETVVWDEGKKAEYRAFKQAMTEKWATKKGARP